MSTTRYQGIVYDILDEVIIDRSCIEWNEEGNALADAQTICKMNGHDECMAFVYDITHHEIIY